MDYTQQTAARQRFFWISLLREIKHPPAMAVSPELQPKHDALKAGFFAGLGSLESLAEQLGVGVGTARAWHYRERWAEERSETTTSMTTKRIEAAKMDADKAIQEAINNVVTARKADIEKYLDDTINDSELIRQKITGVLLDDTKTVQFCMRDWKDAAIARERNDAVLRRTVGLDRERKDQAVGSVNISIIARRSSNEPATEKPISGQVIEVEDVTVQGEVAAKADAPDDPGSTDGAR